MQEEYAAQGIQIVAVSANARELAERAVEEWGITRIPVGYGLSREQVREWGLYVSAAVKDTEPEWFTEPGLFVVRPDRTLYWSIVQTMPFSRPPGSALLNTLRFVIENDFPARGEVAP